MRFSASALVAGSGFATVASAATNYLGFNSGSTLADGSAKVKSDFEAEFNTAKNLVGAPGTFNAVRLYTNIQGGTTTDPLSAFEAAIDTQTYLLLGIWCSGTTSIANELTALKNAVDQYGTDFTELVIGISIGSEDLYRNSVTGVANDAGVGAQPDTILGFINDFKDAFANTSLASIPVGHVDTWDVWPNSTNSAVLDAVDWIGVDEYPYYENGKNNTIDNSGELFDTAWAAVTAVAGDKPIWLTETGWPYSGPDWDLGVPSVENAKYYWDEVGCRVLFNKHPTFWFTLEDTDTANTMSFAITSNLSTTPRFNLTCPTTFVTPNTTASSSSSTTSGGSSSSTGSSSGSSSSNSTSSTTSSSSGSATTTAASGATALNVLTPAIYGLLALAAGAALL